MLNYLIRFTLHHHTTAQGVRNKIESFIEYCLDDAENIYNGKYHKDTRLLMKFKWQHAKNHTETLISAENVDEKEIIKIFDKIGKYLFDLVEQNGIECDYLASRILRYKNNKKA